MATSYTVLSITNEALDWLKKKGVAYSASSQSSRYPSLNEIRNVLDDLKDCTTAYTISTQTWQAVISDDKDRWTSLVVLDYHGKEGEDDISHKFYFEKGWPNLMERILKELSRICGPFVLMSNADLEPTLIIPDTDVDHENVKRG